MIDLLPIQVRPPLSSDYAFIISSFLQNLHKTTPYNFIPNDIFFPYYTELFNKILERSSITIAHLYNFPNDIVGFIITEQYDSLNTILYYATVKSIYRRQGVFNNLSEDFLSQNLICPFYFPLLPKLRLKYSLIFDPTILNRIK